MTRTINARIAAILIAVAATVGGVYWYTRHAPAPAPSAAPPVAQPQPDATPAGPVVRYPVPEPEIADEDEEALPPALPDLQESDPLALESLLTLYPDPLVAALVKPEFVIPRIVATIDNLPRDRLNAHAMPVKPVPGLFAVDTQGDVVTLSDANAARYQVYVDAFVAADTAQLVSQYHRFYPLFQRAYRELGDPDAYFNDRLVDVIDHMLQAPEAQAPIALVKPRTAWEFANPEWQSQSIGHRLMLRIGSAHAARIKAKLGELRAALVAEAPVE